MYVYRVCTNRQYSCTCFHNFYFSTSSQYDSIYLDYMSYMYMCVYKVLGQYCVCFYYNTFKICNLLFEVFLDMDYRLKIGNDTQIDLRKPKHVCCHERKSGLINSPELLRAFATRNRTLEIEIVILKNRRATQVHMYMFTR